MVDFPKTDFEHELEQALNAEGKFFDDPFSLDQLAFASCKESVRDTMAASGDIFLDKVVLADFYLRVRKLEVLEPYLRLVYTVNAADTRHIVPCKGSGWKELAMSCVPGAKEFIQTYQEQYQTGTMQFQLDENAAIEVEGIDNRSLDARLLKMLDVPYKKRSLNRVFTLHADNRKSYYAVESADDAEKESKRHSYDPKTMALRVTYALKKVLNS